MAAAPSVVRLPTARSYSGDAEEGEKVTEKEKDKNADVKEEGKNDGKPKRHPPMCI